MRAAEADDEVAAADGPGFSLATTKAGEGHIVVRVVGDLDIATAPRLEETLVGLIEGLRVELIDLDLAELAFIDSTALGVIVGAHQRIRSDGGQLRLCNPGPTVAKVLDITGLARALTMGPEQR